MRCQHMRWDLTIAAVVVLGLLAAHGQAGETKQSPTYATPQAAFAAAQKAAEKKDYKALLGTLATDDRDTLVGGLLVMGSLTRTFGPKFAKTDEDKAKLQKIEDILNKHGVTAELSKEAVEIGIASKGKEPSEVLSAMRKLAQQVKDRTGLAAQLITLAEQDKKAKGSPFDDLKTAQLKDVKVEGNIAKGMLTVTKDGMEKTEPIEFRKEGAGWKLHIDLNKKK